jgi:putative CocE/NonD family hydrolase
VASDAWPPREAKARNLYFHDGGRLNFDRPAEEDAADSYVSDPAHPVPYRRRPIEPTYGGKSGWSSWLVEDQRFVDGRPDVLSWQTDALDESLTISGRIRAHLFASTTGADADWIVKLIDRYPDDYKDPPLRGYQLMIAGEVLRSRFRHSFEKPEPVSPGEVVEYMLDLHTNNHCFLKGHRVMVQVQSSWFPVIDRNPQKYVPNIFLAKPEDYQAATQRVFRSRRQASSIELPVR